MQEHLRAVHHHHGVFGGIEQSRAVVEDGTLTVPADVTRKLPSNWPSLDGYKIGKASVCTLLKGSGVSGIEIRLVNGRFVTVACGEDETVIDLRTNIKNDA